MNRVWRLLPIMVLSGCSVLGTPWQPPEVAPPTAWSVPLPQEQREKAERQQEHDFWQSWQDPQLLEWIQQSWLANHDLQLALARLREARAQQRMVGGGEQPVLDANAAVLRDRISENNRVPLYGLANPVTLHQVGFDARWEWDLFGRQHLEREAAQAETVAMERGLEALQITLAAEVAVTYCDWRLAHQQIALLQQQAAISRTLLQLVISRVQAGLNPELDRHRAEDQALQIEARLPAARAAAEVALRRLAILTGAQADALLGTELSSQPLPAQVPPLPELLPAELLERRADLKAAEAKARAAHARVGVAEGEKWPELSLAATVGTLSVASASLFSPGSRFFQAGPQLKWPIFHGEALAAAVAVAEAKRDQERIAWLKAAAEAIEEVEKGLLRHQEAVDKDRLLQSALQAQQQALKLAQVRYQRGMSDFSVPLELARQVMAMELERLEMQRLRLSSGIALYKALGGGWRAEKAP
ncbi:efflux transporter outer membrane subunit [Candidatus Magnetaquicoccus inordinatus]|uniref:efflux transporter outer membrane subunit n=1 Tax=Candidatus Magnetaquicoccus inordinatus TaxID=2496818 RepID=UPI00102BD6F2|nr:efflux transporter outer membrane subunit [Candidatus Magnetaquicoccus inordinatus]